MPLNIGAVSYGTATGMYLLLTMLLLVAWRGRLRGALLLNVAAFSVVWCGLAMLHALIYQEDIVGPQTRLLAFSELVRNAAWFAFALSLLGWSLPDFLRPRSSGTSAAVRLMAMVICTMVVVHAVTILTFATPVLSMIGITAQLKLLLIEQLLLAVFGLTLVEQLIRNNSREGRGALKYLLLAAGGLFAYDFFLYSHAALFNRLDPAFWNARGFVNALVVPLIAVSAARNPNWSLEIFVSRQVVFHSAAFVATGLYLMFMAASGYYIRVYGGAWGSVAQAAFWFAAIVALALVLGSSQIRARTKIFLTKHFFRNAYEYREEWLRFTMILSTSEGGEELRRNIVRGIAQIVDSSGGILWMLGERRRYRPTASWQMKVDTPQRIESSDSLIRFLSTTGWVVRLDEARAYPERYEGLELPAWLRDDRSAWLLVPMFQRDDLLGFLIIARSMTKTEANWEDTDLLKTVGRQAAGYLALLNATDALAEARQFEAYNRLSAYVVHDLKNLAAQLSLVVSNAEHHMHNPEFMRDAIQTVGNATSKLNRMLVNLRKGRLEDTTTQLVNVRPILEKVAKARANDWPVPALLVEDDGLVISADPERLSTVMEHIVQNAQEATERSGSVTIRARRAPDAVVLEVEDSGCGMGEDFINERLFRPFDSTKGNAGMGIGAYESREFIVSLGGEVEVESEVGRGTTFRVHIPTGPRMVVPTERRPMEVRH